LSYFATSRSLSPPIVGERPGPLVAPPRTSVAAPPVPRTIRFGSRVGSGLLRLLLPLLRLEALAARGAVSLGSVHCLCTLALLFLALGLLHPSCEDEGDPAGDF
jgi:hypothetical protein